MVARFHRVTQVLRSFYAVNLRSLDSCTERFYLCPAVKEIGATEVVRRGSNINHFNTRYTTRIRSYRPTRTVSKAGKQSPCAQEENKRRPGEHIALSLSQQAKDFIIKITSGDQSFDGDIETPVNRDNVRHQQKLLSWRRNSVLVPKL